MGPGPQLIAVEKLDAERRRELEEILRRFESEASGAATPDELSPLLPPEGEPLRGRALVELIKLDQDRRWQGDDPRLLESYLEVWPELRASPEAVAELLAAELRCRSAAHGTVPEAKELARRFPELDGAVDLTRLAERARARPEPGEFDGTERFGLLRKIGQGGMGVVYEVLDRDRGARVALKTLPQVRPVALYRFKREFRLLTELVHPNLIELYELISSDERWFFTMEVVDGVDFTRWVRPSADSLAPESLVGVSDDELPAFGKGAALRTLDVDRLRAALRQLAAGVAALHEAGKLHRDLKPSNVLVRRDGRVVVLDFGLVTELDRDAGPTDDPDADEADAPGSGRHHQPSDLSDHRLIGTVPYMAPEQAAGQTLGPACDWYAVGVMLYEALTGREPFSGRPFHVLRLKQTRDPIPPAERARGIPDDLSELCMRLLARDPQERAGAEDVFAVCGQPLPAFSTGGTSSETALGGRPVLVGRAEHLTRMRAAFDRVVAGEPAALHVHGRSGAGKTTLVDHFLDDLGMREAVILAGRCFEQESVPYKAIDALVDELSRHLVRLRPMERQALLPRDVASLARVFPVLRRVEGVEPATDARRAIPDDQESRRRAFRALRELLERIGAKGPLVLAIDDLQWGDLDSAQVLAELVRPPDPPRMLLLISYRTDDADRSECVKALQVAGRVIGEPAPRYEEIEVLPLSLDEARELALELLEEKREGARELADQIARESRGSPYFVLELARSLRSGSDLPRLAGGADLDEVIRVRVQSLPAEARRLLETLAVAGRPTRVREACHAAALGADEQQAVRTLRAGNLARTTGPGLDDYVETYHDRIRESVVGGLGADDLRARHRGLAAALEASGGADAETLAIHFGGAGDAAKAAHYQAVAAEQAARALAFDRAVKLYRQALEHAPADARGALEEKLADALANAGRGVEAARAYESAARGAQGERYVHLQQRAAYQYCVSGYVDEGRAAFSEVLERVGMRMPRTPGRALFSLLARRAMLWFRGRSFHERPESEVPADALARVDISWAAATALTMVDPVRGAHFMMKTLVLALRAGEPYRISRALALEALHVGATGPGALAERLLEEAETLARRIDHPHALGVTKLSAAIVAFSQGDWERAHILSTDANAILRLRCTGATWERDTANVVSLFALTNLGRATERRQRVERLLEEAEERGDLYAATTLGAYHVPLSRMGTDDDPEAARRACDAALARWSQQGFHMQHATALMAQVYIDLYVGDGRRAYERLQERWGDMRRALLLRTHVIRINMLHLRGQAAVAAAVKSDDPEPYLRAAERDVAALGKEPVRWARATAKLVRACVIRARRADRKEALDALGDAIGSLDDVGLHFLAMMGQRRLGQLLGGERGAGLLARADEWMTRHGIVNRERLTRMYTPAFDDD